MDRVTKAAENAGVRPVDGGSADSERLTYGTYLRVPELLSLQFPLGYPEVHDEMLFILGQQAQELWFKQILYELRAAIDLLSARAIAEALRPLDRMNRILRVLSEEVEVMETISPVDFHHFRQLLKSASGFESEQFRELELASGLDGEPYLRMVNRFVDLEGIRLRWPVTLHAAFVGILQELDPDPVSAVVQLYRDPWALPLLHNLAETLSEYELRFNEWRYHHLKLVERVIGDRSGGTGGSAGSGYLYRTLEYRFFPELWEARNRLTAMSARPGP